MAFAGEIRCDEDVTGTDRAFLAEAGNTCSMRLLPTSNATRRPLSPVSSLPALRLQLHDTLLSERALYGLTGGNMR